MAIRNILSFQDAAVKINDMTAKGVDIREAHVKKMMQF